MEDDENSCDICNEDFDTDTYAPRKLPCCHTFCSQCLERLVSPTATITCPNDRSVHQLGDLGIFGLPLDSSKLPDANRQCLQTPHDSVIIPSISSATHRNVRRVNNRMNFVHPEISNDPPIQIQTSQEMHADNGNGQHFEFYSVNYPAYINQHQQMNYQPPGNYSYHQGVEVINGWHSTFQPYNNSVNPPFQLQPFINKTMQTTVAQFGDEQVVNIQGPRGNVQIRNSGQCFNTMYKF